MHVQNMKYWLWLPCFMLPMSPAFFIAARCLETVLMSAPTISVNSPTQQGAASRLSMMRSRDGCASSFRRLALRVSLCSSVFFMIPALVVFGVSAKYFVDILVKYAYNATCAFGACQCL